MFDELTYTECQELRLAVRKALFRGEIGAVLADKMLEALHRRVWRVNPEAIQSGEYV